MKRNNIVKKIEIKEANEACDIMENCNKCSIAYRGFQGDKNLVPCNFIRKKYGESIWDYKEEYRTGLIKSR